MQTFRELLEAKSPYKTGQRFYVNEEFASSYSTYNSNKPITVKEGMIIQVNHIKSAKKEKYGWILEGLFTVISGFKPGQIPGTSQPTITKIDTNLMVVD